MKTKIFYDHLIVIEEITAILDGHHLTQSERHDLLNYIDQTLHHHILDTILTHLPAEYHTEFLSRFHDTPHDPKIMFFLQEHGKVNMERAILKEANRVKKEILSMIETSKRI